MYDTHIVFLIGMVTSFLMFLWAISFVEQRFFAKRKKKKKVYSDRHFRAFRQHLKRESYLRAVQMIKGVQNGLERDFRMRSRPRRPGREKTDIATASSVPTQDVVACVALVEELFTEASARQFGYFVKLLVGVRESGNLADSTRFATAALECLRNELCADAAADNASQVHGPVAVGAHEPRGDFPKPGPPPALAPTAGTAFRGRLPHSLDRSEAGAFRPLAGTTPIDASAG